MTSVSESIRLLLRWTSQVLINYFIKCDLTDFFFACDFCFSNSPHVTHVHRIAYYFTVVIISTEVTFRVQLKEQFLSCDKLAIILLSDNTKPCQKVENVMFLYVNGEARMQYSSVMVILNHFPPR